MAGATARTLVRTALVSLVLVGLTAAGFLAIEALGAGDAPLRESMRSDAEKASGAADFPRVLVALAAIIVVSRGLGWAFRRIAQPRVIGEVVAGILLGPSFLGAFWPDLSHAIFPTAVVPLIHVVAQVGVVLFIFVVGIELDANLLRSQTLTTVAISHASIVVPFLLGSALAGALHPSFAPPGVPFRTFALFLGVSMSVTAFPVLARILTDRGLTATQLGSLALTCAAVDDVTAWCLLAYVVGVVKGDARGTVLTVILVVGFAALMLFLVRPLLGRFAAGRADRDLRQGVFAGVLLGVLLSALATEWIGVHAVFGAFLFGAAIPRDAPLARQVRSRIEDISVVLLLPAFFAYTGLRTDVGRLDGVESWLVCASIVAVACAGKFGGSYLAARVTGVRAREAAALGVLMNTRGLMELVVLNIGLELGVVSTELFTMLVLMAVVTTVAAAPLLRLLVPATNRLSKRDPDST